MNKFSIIAIVIIPIFLAYGFTVFSKQNEDVEPKPNIRITFPEKLSVESGVVLIMAEQEKKKLSSDSIKSVRFKYSSNKTNWFIIKELTDALADIKGLDEDKWEARWETSDLASGDYFLRASIETFAGKTDRSTLLPVEINKEPTAIASASKTDSGPIETLGAEPIPLREATILFDGSASLDQDGTVTSWTWDFGDGSTGDGKSVQHIYTDTVRSFDITLTVEDNSENQNTAHYTIESFFDIFVMKQDTKCICKDIVLRGDDLPEEANGFGPDGAAAGNDWKITKNMDDGKTLGPLNNNPENETKKGEKKWTGYAFEVVADVEGDPKLCKEIQLVQSTYDTRKAKKWKGTKSDLNKDGVDDIDVSTAAKCAATGGVWDAATGKCTLEFPLSDPPKYGPDTPEDNDPGGAYESPFTFKKHPDNKIIWYDTPAISADSQSPLRADFVSIVRGTDSKYCYVKSALNLERKGGKDKEELTQIDQKIDADSIPGVP